MIRTIQDVKDHFAYLDKRFGIGKWQVDTDFTKLESVTRVTDALQLLFDMRDCFMVCAKYNQDIYEIAERERIKRYRRA